MDQKRTNPQKELDSVNRKYVELSKRHGMNPVWLREIIDLRNRGFNYTQIEERTGINRETVAGYLQKLGSLDKKDYWLLVVGAGLILCGVGLIGYFLGKTGSSTPSPSDEEEQQP